MTKGYITRDFNRDRLKHLEDIIHGWKVSGRLWDMEDPEVAAVLAERDELFYKVNPQCAGLNFHDMKDEDWEALDKKVAENKENKGGDT